jgi:hypothetical protein
MISFKCANENCPSKDVENNFRGNPATAICGGCNTVLVGYNEQADPEIPAETQE